MFHKRFPRRTSGFFSNFYRSPPFPTPPPPVANPKNGTIPVLHVSLPALGCPHTSSQGVMAWSSRRVLGDLTTILPLSRLCQQLQPTCSGSRSDLQKKKRGSFASFSRVFSQASKAAGSSWACQHAARAVGRWKGTSKKFWEVVWVFKRKPAGNTRNETDPGRGSNTSQGLLCWEGVTPVPCFFSKVWKTWEPLM